MDDQKEELTKLLATLKRNRENVPLKELKTKYKTAYSALCNKICMVAEEYVKSISLEGIKAYKQDVEDAVSIINLAVENSNLLKEISKALFSLQNIFEVEVLALQLRETVLDALQPYYAKHICLLITKESLDDDNPVPPLIYDEINNLFYRDGHWIEKNMLPDYYADI